MSIDKFKMWTCTRYGVAMLAAHAPGFCARRFVAANREEGSYAAGFLYCRTCARGATQYELVRRGDVPKNGKRPCRKKNGLMPKPSLIIPVKTKSNGGSDIL